MIHAAASLTDFQALAETSAAVFVVIYNSVTVMLTHTFLVGAREISREIFLGDRLHAVLRDDLCLFGPDNSGSLRNWTPSNELLDNLERQPMRHVTKRNQLSLQQRGVNDSTFKRDLLQPGIQQR